MPEHGSCTQQYFLPSAVTFKSVSVAAEAASSTDVFPVDDPSIGPGLCSPEHFPVCSCALAVFNLLLRAGTMCACMMARMAD